MQIWLNVLVRLLRVTIDDQVTLADRKVGFSIGKFSPLCSIHADRLNSNPLSSRNARILAYSKHFQSNASVFFSVIPSH